MLTVIVTNEILTLSMTIQEHITSPLPSPQQYTFDPHQPTPLLLSTVPF